MSINRPKLSFEQAIAAYLQYAPRCPQVDPASVPAKTQYVGNLLEIADQFDLIVFDAFGVLNSGAQAILGAVETVSALQKSGNKLARVTNDASCSPDAILAPHPALGLDFHTTNPITLQPFVSPVKQP